MWPPSPSGIDDGEPSILQPACQAVFTCQHEEIATGETANIHQNTNNPAKGQNPSVLQPNPAAQPQRVAANHPATHSARNSYEGNHHDVDHLSQHNHKKALNNCATATDTKQLLQAADHNSQLQPITTQGRCSEFEDCCNNHCKDCHDHDDKLSPTKCRQAFDDHANSFDFQQFMISDG